MAGMGCCVAAAHRYIYFYRFLTQIRFIADSLIHFGLAHNGMDLSNGSRIRHSIIGFVFFFLPKTGNQFADGPKSGKKLVLPSIFFFLEYHDSINRKLMFNCCLFSFVQAQWKIENHCGVTAVLWMGFIRIRWQDATTFGDSRKRTSKNEKHYHLHERKKTKIIYYIYSMPTKWRKWNRSHIFSPCGSNQLHRVAEWEFVTV